MDQNPAWLKAFPADLRPLVESAAARLPPDEHSPGEPYRFALNGEELWIPYRLYKPEPDLRACTGTEGMIISCIYTRHHSGFVREAHLRRLLQGHHDWMAPFVVQLLGEYVIPIHRLLLANRQILLSKGYSDSWVQNPDFVQRTKSRIISYWHCYYRATPLQEYAAFQLADALGWWKKSDIPRLRREMKHP